MTTGPEPTPGETIFPFPFQVKMTRIPAEWSAMEAGLVIAAGVGLVALGWWSIKRKPPSPPPKSGDADTAPARR